LLELENPDVWSDPARAQQLGKDKSALETVVDGLAKALQSLDDATELLELAVAEDDEATVDEVVTDLDGVEETVAALEFHRMFSGEMDAKNAFLEIQSGAGGTEAQDWADMLLRMYLRWGEAKGFKTELIEVSDGDVAGIKSATVRFEGPYAFGWLRTETGVHRLVVPRQWRRRPARQSHRISGAHHACADQCCGAVPERPLAAQEQGNRDETAQGQAL